MIEKVLDYKFLGSFFDSQEKIVVKDNEDEVLARADSIVRCVMNGHFSSNGHGTSVVYVDRDSKHKLAKSAYDWAASVEQARDEFIKNKNNTKIKKEPDSQDTSVTDVKVFHAMSDLTCVQNALKLHPHWIAGRPVDCRDVVSLVDKLKEILKTTL